WGAELLRICTELDINVKIISSMPDKNFNFLPQPVPLKEQHWADDTIQYVSISCTTYNHESYIKDAIDGFLMQKTTFPVKIVVFEDCSTDGTKAILEDYEKKYPQLFAMFYQPVNTYKKPFRRKAKQIKNKERDKAKYIALCEGDDYWTDPLKLQKQVEFLEEHPDFMVTSSGYIKKNRDFEEEDIRANDPSFVNETDRGFEFDLFSKGWLTKTLTSLFRNDQ